MAYSLSANFEPQPTKIFFVKLNDSLAEVKITNYSLVSKMERKGYSLMVVLQMSVSHDSELE